MRLKELADDLKSQRQNIGAKGRKAGCIPCGRGRWKCIDLWCWDSFEEEDCDEDEDMVLPAMNGKVDPALLAALPPSMQLDLSCSDEREVDGREQTEISKCEKAGVERHGEKLDQTSSEPAPSVPLDRVASTRKSNTAIVDDDIQTYLDERGNVRVSRVRALGICMIRDLQRNLDLIKEIEQDIVHTNEIANSESVLDKNAGGGSRTLPDKVHVKETSCQGSGGSVHLDDRNDQSASNNPNLIEISFDDDCGHKCLDGYDHLFARLVAGDPVMISSGDDSPSKKHSFKSDSDCDWEGVIEEKGDSSTHDVRKERRLSFAEGGSNYDSEVEWEDGDSDVLKYASTSHATPRKTSSKDDKSKKARKMAGEIAGVGSVCQENDNTEPNLPLENVVQIDKSSYGVVSGVESLDGEARMNKLHTDIFPGQRVCTINISDMVSEETPCVILADAQLNDFEAAENQCVLEKTEQGDSSIKESTNHDVVQEMSEEKKQASLEEEMLNLRKEHIDLADEQRKLEHNAESVSGEMFAECQHFLEAMKHVYGYRYKYYYDTGSGTLRMSEEKLILMALLLGSDYTEVGLGLLMLLKYAFPEEDGLCKFREWIESPNPTILGKFDMKTGSSSRKRGSKLSGNNVSCSNSTMEGLAASDQTVLQTMDYILKTKQIFMDKHIKSSRNVSKNWHIPSTFPNEAVISAYASPQVDNSTEPFSWGKPALFVLRQEEREGLEDVGRTPETKVVEDLMCYDLSESSSDCFFLTGSNLTERERTELIEFITANIEVFPWTLYDMPGIDPIFIKHELNAIPEASPRPQLCCNATAALNSNHLVAALLWLAAPVAAAGLSDVADVGCSLHWDAAAAGYSSLLWDAAAAGCSLLCDIVAALITAGS
ncbi:5'-3' exonuclease family protein [Actinidia rufa]|uniref:5'-3' exonuclease family protein n=1 Tax=Actinidia rufa TaxID=165716 RepID=A0A7J0H8M6_9ERIC|nr:5'-3' exonuclease family protein [Actinidia rufa]